MIYYRKSSDIYECLKLRSGFNKIDWIQSKVLSLDLNYLILGKCIVLTCSLCEKLNLLQNITFSTSCDVSVKYYPFDKQMCRIIFSEAFLSKSMVTLETLSEVPTSHIRTNSEWDLQSVSISKTVFYQSDLIIMEFHLQRRYTL